MALKKPPPQTTTRAQIAAAIAQQQARYSRRVVFQEKPDGLATPF